MQISDSLKIVAVKSEQDIRQLTDVHREVFTDNLSGPAGRHFIERFFKKVMNSSSGIIFACKDQNKIVGFIAGAASKKGIFDSLFFLEGMLVSFCQLFVRPAIILNIAMQVKRVFLPKIDEPEAELLTIGLKKEYRGLGIGDRLIKSLEEFLVMQAVEDYKVYTDSKFVEGIKLYERSGFVLKRQAHFLHISECLYVKHLKRI